MINLLKIKNERVFITEYHDYCDVKPEDNSLFGYNMVTGVKNEWKFKGNYTCTEEKIKDYGNLLCSVNIIRHTLCLDENDDIVSIRAYFFTKNRRVGSRFFKTNTNMKFLTYNKKTKNFYNGSMFNYHLKRKRTSSIKCNFFFDNFFNHVYYSFARVNQNTPQPILEFDKSKVDEIFQTFLSKVGIENEFNNKTFINDLFGKLLDDKGIKKPNNFYAFKYCIPRPTKKIYKNNKNKMVESYMDMYGIHGDKMKKILHNLKEINLKLIKQIIDIFGHTYLSQKSEIDLILFYENIIKNNIFLDKNFIDLLSKKEKENFFKCVLIIDNNVGINQWSFNDHMVFYKKILKYEKIKWKSFDLNSFKSEHIEYSEKSEFYSKGYYVRNYDNKFKDYIQEEIVINNQTYWPILLEEYEQYTEESSHQSNCVKTYNSRVDSVIVSLRNESNDRLTIQMIPKKNNNGKIFWKNAQTRAKFNEMYTEDWILPITILEERFSTSKFELPEFFYVNYLGKNKVNVTFNEVIEETYDSGHIKPNQFDLLNF